MKKLKSSTLVETLTAASILSIVAGLAILIFLQLSTPSSNGATLLRAQHMSYEQIPLGIFTDAKENPTLILESTDALLGVPSWEWKGDKLRVGNVQIEDTEGNIIYERKRLYYAR